MKIIPRTHLRPGERRQRAVVDLKGNVLKEGSPGRARITLEGKQADKRIPLAGKGHEPVKSSLAKEKAKR